MYIKKPINIVLDRQNHFRKLSLWGPTQRLTLDKRHIVSLKGKNQSTMTTPHTLGRYPIDAAAAPDVDSIVVPAGEYSPGSAEEKRLVRKIDLHLVPMVWLMYIMVSFSLRYLGFPLESPFG